MSDSSPLLTRIGDYAPERLLGSGAMASVYLCKGPDGKRVAVKWVDTTLPAHIKRFEREVDVLKGLTHPGIVGFIDEGVHEGRPFLVMEWADGLDLQMYARKLYKRPAAERYQRCRIIGKALCEVLTYLHSRGLIHRDIKPSNVLLTHSGRVVLADFGVVTDSIAADYSMTGLMVGTRSYAAPEQLAGDVVTVRSDLYGLGATLYFLLTLQGPFDRRDRQPQMRPIPPSSIEPGIPVQLESVVQRLMSHKPSHRYLDAAAAAQELSDGSQRGTPLAGRATILEEVARGFSLAKQGEAVVMYPAGPPGVGKGWLTQIIREGARRQELHLIELESEESFKMYRNHEASGLRAVGLALSEDCKIGLRSDETWIEIRLAALSLAEIRRTVVAMAPLTKDPAEQAAALFYWTGGLPGLLLPLMDRFSCNQALLLPLDFSDSLKQESGLATDLLGALDMDSTEVLGVLSLFDEPTSADRIEVITQIPAGRYLRHLESLGLVTEVCGSWMISNAWFRHAAIGHLIDPEGMADRVTTLANNAAGAATQGGLSREHVHAQMIAKANAAFGSGDLAGAIRDLKRTEAFAHVAGDRVHECQAMCLLGRIWLEMGAVSEGAKRLADATVLARATGQHDVRRLCHAFRAIAELENHRGDRSAAVAAIHRVVHLITRSEQTCAASSDAFLFAVWAWGAAILGDKQSALEATENAQQRLEALGTGERASVMLRLARAAAAEGKMAAQSSWIAQIRRETAEQPFWSWRAACAALALDGQKGPSPGGLAEGLGRVELRGLIWRQNQG